MTSPLAVVFALAAAVMFGLGNAIEHQVARTVPASRGVSVRVLGRLARSPKWLLGMVNDVGAFGFQAAALAFGGLLLVQPLLVCGLLVALALGAALHLPLIDPLFGAAIGIWIVYSAVRLVRLSLFQLMDHEMTDDEREKIRTIAQSHPDVAAAHDLRTRVAGPTAFIQIHIEMDGSLNLVRAHEISDEVEAKLRSAYPNAEIIIHQDPEGIEERARSTFDQMNA